jgi:hypothetical protein
LRNVPNSVEKRIREEDSSFSYDDVVLKKMRKECSLGTFQEGSHETFLGRSHESEKEKMKDNQKLESIGEESSSTANNNSGDKSENNNGNEKVEIVNENEDVGVSIVQRNKEGTAAEKNTAEQDTVEGSTMEGRTGTGTQEKEEENSNNNSSSNNSNSNNESDVSDEPAVGSRVGSVPTEKEAREIFSMKRIDSGHKSNLNVYNKKNGNDNGDGNESVKQRDGDGGDVIPSMLVFPAYTVSMQMTRGGPNTGPGVSAFRSTVSKTSRDFNSLWTPSSSSFSDCTATARTLHFSCHDASSRFSLCHIDVLLVFAYCLPHLPVPLTSIPPPLSPLFMLYPLISSLFPLLSLYFHPTLDSSSLIALPIFSPPLSFTHSPFPSLVSLLILQSSPPPFSLILCPFLPSYHSPFLPLPSPPPPFYHSALITAAVDCEMCETALGLELTRLTVIDKDHAVVLDTLVKPKNRIINYLTKYSGMTEELLQSVTVTLEQAQIAFMRLISKETILIGMLQY